MTQEDIKLHQLTGQHLLEPADCRTIVRDLCGLQAQFLGNALHGLRIRSHGFQESDLAGMVKSWTIRGTVHIFSREDLPLFLHQGRNHHLRPCDTLGADEYITRERKQFFADLIVANIAAGQNAREELKAICLDHGMTEQEQQSIFNSWGGTIRALCENGTLVHELSEKKAFALCPPFSPMEEEPARLEMARRYFTHFGPATIKDAAYFFGTTQTQVKQWLTQLPAESTDCGGRTYYYIEDAACQRILSASPGIPDCIFLAGFDQLMMGYQKTESLYLPQEHLRNIFNLAGIVMPALLLHGRVVGKWKQKGAKVTVTLFESVSAKEKGEIKARAAALWPNLSALEFIS